MTGAAATRPPARRSGRGRFIVLVGPDGVGKTATARAIIEAANGPTAYFHFCPPAFGSLPSGPGPDPVPRPKNRHEGWKFVGWLRLARNVARAWLAYLITLRPLLASGTLVVGDRWMYGYVVHPVSLRFAGPRWLARMAIRALPRPDLVANLVAAPSTIRNRKQELTVDQIVEELQEWTVLPVARVRSFDADGTPDDLAATILGAAS